MAAQKSIKSLTCTYEECGQAFTTADNHYYHEVTDLCYCSEGCYEAEVEGCYEAEVEGCYEAEVEVEEEAEEDEEDDDVLEIKNADRIDQLHDSILDLDNLNVYFKTNGKGYYTKRTANVPIIQMEIQSVNCRMNYAELNVYIDTDVWCNNNEDCIYTDPQFLIDLKKFLNNQDIDISDINYSEAGMQGDDYVSFDVGKKFIDSWFIMLC